MLHRENLAFPMEEYQRRVRSLRKRMVAKEFDAIVVTTPENICYLTGFDTPGYYTFGALIVPVDSECVMVPRLLEEAGIQARTWLSDIRAYSDDEDPIEKLATTLADLSLTNQRLGYERDGWFFTATQQERLFSTLPGSNFVDCSGIVEEGRLIKSDLEIEMIRRAARTAEAGIKAGLEAVRPGATDNDVAAAIHHGMISAGSRWPAISPFVAVGARGAVGHATWADVEIEEGDCVFIEVGGCIQRYHAALMRTACVGQPDPRVEMATNTVLEATAAIIEQAKPGMTLEEADLIGRNIIADAAASFNGTQMTRSGYSIGIGFPPDWGEGHMASIGPGSKRVLEPNMTFHLIPWVQLPGRAGVGMSETIRITEKGCESLTTFSRALHVAEV